MTASDATPANDSVSATVTPRTLVTTTTKPRSEAVMDIVRAAHPQRLSTSQILAALHDQGRDDDATALHRTLYSLKTQGRIDTPGRMQGWHLTDSEAPTNAESPALTGLSVVSGPTTEGGEAREEAHHNSGSLPGWDGRHGRAPAIVL